MTIIIDGETFDVPVKSWHEVCSLLDKYAERTEDGILQRELIGTYHNYQIVIGNHTSASELAALWLKFTEATAFHTVTVPDVAGYDYTFTAYFGTIERDLLKLSESLNIWKDYVIHFIARSPRRTPS